MSLPVLEQKYFRAKIFSNGQEVQFRPFTIGQQKDIMVIRETSEDDALIYAAIVDMIQDCVKGLDVKDLYVVDFEKLFYDIKSIADGNEVSFTYKCRNKKCDNENTFTLNTKNDFEITNKEFTRNIKVDEANIAINLRHHKIKDLFTIENKKYKSNEEKIFDSMIYCIESIVDGEKVINDFTHEEALKFVESLPDKYLKVLIDFYKNIPTIKLNKKFKCEKCNTELNVSNEDFKSFF